MKTKYTTPKLLILGSLVHVTKAGGSKCSEPPCNQPNPPPQCDGC